MAGDYRALKSELAKAKYASRTPAQKAAMIRSELIDRSLDIPAGVWREAMASAGLWGRAVLISRMQPSGTVAEPSEQDRIVARVIDLVAIAEYGAETRKPGVLGRVTALLDAIVADGVFGTTLRNALHAFTAEKVSRAEDLGFADLNDQDILAAEKWYG